MGAAHSALPAGYVRFSVRHTEVVCASYLDATLREVLERGTLYHYGESRPNARSLAGRGVAYAVPLPGNVERVVIRHNRHGGLFAPISGDLFAPPTRAPYELDAAERLRAAGIATPRILAYAIYPAGPFRRADVMSREVPDSADLSTALMSHAAEIRAAALSSAAALVRALAASGARHHDLNIKNVLLRRVPHALPEALVLDVDRVTFGGSFRELLELNLARLLRSARKWQREHGAQVTGTELEFFAAMARDPARRPVNTSL